MNLEKIRFRAEVVIACRVWLPDRFIVWYLSRAAGRLEAYLAWRDDGKPLVDPIRPLRLPRASILLAPVYLAGGNLYAALCCVAASIAGDPYYEPEWRRPQRDDPPTARPTPNQAGLLTAEEMMRAIRSFGNHPLTPPQQMSLRLYISEQGR